MMNIYLSVAMAIGQSVFQNIANTPHRLPSDKTKASTFTPVRAL